MVKGKAMSRAQWLALAGVFASVVFGAYYLGVAAGRVVGIEAALNTGISQVARVSIPSVEVEMPSQESTPTVDPANLDSLKESAIRARPKSANTDLAQAGIAPDAAVQFLRPNVLPAPLNETPVTPEPTPASSTVRSDKVVARPTPVATPKGTPATPTEMFSKILEEREKKVDAATPKELSKATPMAVASSQEFAGADTLSMGRSKTKSLPKGWFAQVMATSNNRDAESLAQKLRAGGFPVVLEETTVNGKSHYRLLVGPERSRSLAGRLVDQLQREPGVAAKPFVRVVE